MPRVGKKEMVKALQEKGYTKKQASKAIDDVFGLVADNLKSGNEVAIVGFGTFDVRERKARTGKHPQTKEPLHIPAKRVPAFSAGKALRASV